MFESMYKLISYPVHKKNTSAYAYSNRWSKELYVMKKIRILFSMCACVCVVVM